MIKIKLSEITAGVETIKDIVNKPVSGKTAYQIARLAREIEREYNLSEEQRDKLVQKYAECDESGNPITDNQGLIHVDNKKIQDYIKEYNELVETEVELNVDKIKLDDLNCEFTATQIIKLMPFIEE